MNELTHRIDTSTKLEVIQCGTCGVWHAIPKTMFDTCFTEGGFWHCPNGHSRGYSEGSIKKQLEKEIKRRKWAEESNKNLREKNKTLGNRLSAQKAATTRMKKRSAAGVCPCCKRTFSQLARHMKSQHPSYGKDDEGQAGAGAEAPSE